MLTPASDSSIAAAAALLRDGECVAFPTETVYGLGADATNARAVARIFSIKQRPSFDPLIVHVADAAAIAEFATDVPPLARALADALWPGPVTIVLPKRDVIPDIVTAGLPSVALRVPDHPVALALIRRASRPIAAPSANPFGYVSPTCAEHVESHLGGLVPLILDGGPCRVGLESTIVSFSSGMPTLLRQGGVPQEVIEDIVGPLVVLDRDGPIQAPGHLPSHYAPRVPLSVITAAAVVPVVDRHHAALLSIGPISNSAEFERVVILSPTGDLEESAANLFAAMRDLDAAGVAHIYAIAPPLRGIGRAIADRLQRAASRDKL